VVARAEGAHIVDVEGRTYIDLVQSYGAVILGHAHPAVTAAVAEAAAGGTSYGAPTPREMKLAEAIVVRVVPGETSSAADLFVAPELFLALGPIGTLRFDEAGR
jgi:glutamate-1-semialdehyde aminotransferase